jgi:hypothetical protein
MQRVIYEGVLGTVLSKGKTDWMVAFPYGVRWIQCKNLTPTWDKVPPLLKSHDRVLNQPA